MSIQALPNEILVKILSWVPLNNLGTTSQVCKDWQEISSSDAISPCTVLTEEIDLYLRCTQEIFQRTMDNLTVADANKQIVELEEAIWNLNRKIEQEPDLSADEQQSIKNQIQTFSALQENKQNFVRMRSPMLANIAKENENFLSKVEHYHCDNSMSSLTKYQKLLNKKIMLLSELFNFCMFATEKDEWENNLPNVNYLTLSQSKMIIQDLIAKKIENFERCINPLFTSKESFNKFQKVSQFHELIDSSETISYTCIKNFIENRLQSLKTGSLDLTRLLSDLTPLILKIPFLIEQPDQIQYKGRHIQPPIKLQLSNHLMSVGVNMGISVINVDTDQVAPLGIGQDQTKPFEWTNTSVLMHTFLSDQLSTGVSYKIRIRLGEYVIKSREFTVLNSL